MTEIIRTEAWTKDGLTAMVPVEEGEVVTVAYQVLAQMLRDLGYERDVTDAS